MTDSRVRVLEILPFWRYAVGPASGTSPAIPFVRRSSAEEFLGDMASAVPWSSHALYRRRWFSDTVDVVAVTPITSQLAYAP